jgi:hypothetical protein
MIECRTIGKGEKREHRMREGRRGADSILDDKRREIEKGERSKVKIRDEKRRQQRRVQ